MKKNKQKLQKELNRIHTELNKINEDRQTKANKKLLGKCFKFQNFEKTSLGDFRTSYYKYYTPPSDEYMEISYEEFKQAWEKFVLELQDQLKIK